MRSSARWSLALAATAALAVAACSRENGTLGPAPFPNSPNVFDDNFGSSVNFAAFGGSKVDALSIDNSVKRSGNSSLKVTVPAFGDPAGSYAGGAFVVGVPRDLSSYNVLSFWARASIPAVLNVAGIGNDNTGTSLYTAQRNDIQLTTSWAKYTIAIPLAAKLTEEQGLFYFAEGPENGAGYDLWIDDIRFEDLNTVVNVRPTITGGAIVEDIGGTRTITGTSVTVSVDGADQTVSAAPAYFTFASSTAAVATVSAAGVISVVGAGTTNITATLGTTPAAGTLALTANPPPAVAAPTPTRLAANVISLFSDAYTNVPIGTWSADWDQADVTDVQIAGNAAKKYSNLTFAGIDFGASRINATTMTHVHADVWVSDASSFKIKLVDFGANGAFGGGDDREHELTLNTTTTPGLTANAWSSLDIPLSAFTGLTTRANLAQIILLGASRTLYLDNLYLYRLPAPTAPVTAAPTPTVNAANVISMFSNAYTNVPVDTWRTDWSQGTVSDTTIAGNATKKYSNLTFVGIEAVSTQINATAMTHFHLDLWTPDAVTGGAAFKVKLVDFGANGAFAGGDDVEHELTFNAASTPALATGSWVSLDIPLSQFTGLTTRAHIAQMILVGDDPINTVYVDNVYFYSATGIAPTAPLTAAPTPTVNAANVISMFSNAYTDVTVDTWRTGWSAATLTDTTVAGNAVKKYTALAFVGIETVAQQINATAMSRFHLDLWTPDALTGGAAFKVKLVDFGANAAFGGGDDTEHELTFTSASTPALATGGWVSLDLPLSLFTGLTSRAHIAQLILVGDDPINTVFVDNVYFYSAAAAAPTVVITSGTTGTATGPVTFTFTFSEDVGTSFIAGDVAVTGGTAGALNRTNATTYTMVVTPTANTAGTMTVTVGSGTFTNLGGTANTAAATINQAFNTAPAPAGASVVSFDETTAPTLSPFEGVTAAAVVADPNNASNMVARITNGVQGAANPWAGVTVSTGGQLSIPQMNVTASLTRMTARVWSPAVGLVIRAKAENAINPAQNHETNATTLTTVANAWETLTFNFAVASPLFDGLPTNPFNTTDTYNKLSFFLDYGTKTNTAPRIFYIDDIRFEGTVGSALPLPAPVVAPTTLPPVPVLAPANVISLHNSSGTYTNIPVGNWSPDWGQGGSISDFVVSSRTLKFLNLVNYQGINISPDGLATGALNITGRNTLHISYWTADGESLRISPINASAEYAITVSSITKNGWTELEIPINQAGFSLTSIRQLKFETTTGLGRFYLDNIYFH